MTDYSTFVDIARTKAASKQILRCLKFEFHSQNKSDECWVECWAKSGTALNERGFPLSYATVQKIAGHWYLSFFGC